MRRVDFDQRADDLEYVAARGKVAARAGDHDGLDALVLCGRAKQIGDLGIAVERQRVLAVGAIERQRRNLAVDRETDMAGAVIGERQGDGIGGSHWGPSLPIALRTDVLVLASRRSSVSDSTVERSANISAIQS